MDKFSYKTNTTNVSTFKIYNDVNEIANFEFNAQTEIGDAIYQYQKITFSRIKTESIIPRYRVGITQTIFAQHLEFEYSYIYFLFLIAKGQLKFNNAIKYFFKPDTLGRKLNWYDVQNNVILSLSSHKTNINVENSSLAEKEVILLSLLTFEFIEKLDLKSY